MAKLISHDFYCIHCGNKGINVMRNDGQMRKKGHLKNLYCIHCRKFTRHYEVYDSEDINKIDIITPSNGEIMALGLDNQSSDTLKGRCTVRMW